MAKRGHASVGDYERALKAACTAPAPPLILIVGGQEHFRHRAVDACVASLRTAQPGIGLATYQGPAARQEQGLPVETLLQELSSSGLFSAAKIVVLRRGDLVLGGGSDDEETKKQSRTARDDPLVAYVAAPNPGMHLLIECDSLDKRTRRGKALVKHGHVIACPTLRYERDCLPWLRATARELGLSLTPQAAEMLFTIHGAEPGILHRELEKLALFVGGGGQIDDTAVRAFMGDSIALSIFELANAVEAGTAGRALRLVRRMLHQGLTDTRGRKANTVGTVHMALGSLRSCLHALWLAHDVAARGGSVKDLEPLLGNRAWRARDLYRAGERFNLRRLRHAYSTLAQTLAGLHDSGSDPELALEQATLALCSPGPAAPQEPTTP